MNLIQLVPIPGHLATSYGKSGKTRDGTGRPWPYSRLITVEAASKRDPEPWMVTPATARGLEALDTDMRLRGSAGLRITDARRLWTRQATERAMYDAWVAAGQPDRGSRGWKDGTMRNVFVKPAGGSHHQWGAALDFDVFALDFPDVAPDDQLAVLWDLAEPYGFKPIIAHPEREQSESWHFDHLGPLEDVYDLFREARRQNAKYGDAYGLTALTGCILTGQYQGGAKLHRLVQARLLLHGQFIGKPDGDIGKMTRAGLDAVGIGGVNSTTSMSLVLARLDELGIGNAQMAAA